MLTATSREAARPDVTPTRPRPVVVVGSVLALVVVVTISTLLGAAELGWTRVVAEIWAQLTGGVSPLSAMLVSPNRP